MRDTADSSNDNKESIWSRFRVLFILMDILGVIAIVCLVTLFCKRFRWLKRMENKDGIEEIKDEKDETFTEEVNGNGQRKLIFLEGEPFFELGDLLKASAEGLGKGTSGNSYKAKLDEGKAVVVKRLRDLKPLSSEEFVKQLLTIAEQKHPNLLPILAYYYSKEEKLVVYKYAENGNLYNRIHGGRGKGRIPFRWNARLSVARGVARALQYLHHNAKSQTIVPHGNLKSSNILLNENNMVLVSDYGLTSLIAFPIAAQRMVAYKSPEYQSTRKVSIKSDIWSYGSLLLELLTGKVPAHSAPPGVIGVDLCSWVHRAVREEWTAEIFDLELSSQRNASQGMVKLLQIAIKCCNKSTEKRPQIAEIVREVESVRANDSEDEDDLSSERSLTDESQSLSASGGIKISE